MFKKSFRSLSLIVATSLLISACGKSDDAPAGVSEAGSSMLEYVPADSPYVFASLAPLPEDVNEVLEPKLDRVLKAYGEAMQQAVESGELQKESGTENAELVQAVVGKLSDLMSIEGMRSAGFDTDSTAVIYGHGLLPVARINLSDGALFEKALADIEAESGEEMATASVGDTSYRYVEGDDMRFVIAVIGDQAVLALLPSEFDEAQASQLLGLEKPAESLADSGALGKMIGDYGFTPHMAGYMDFASIARTLTGDASGLDVATLALADDVPEFSEVCRDEIRALVDVAPRMVVGYSEIKTDLMETLLVFDVRDDIAAGLKTLSAPVPGLGGDAGGLMSFGMSLDLKAAREFAAARVEAVKANPYECELLADLQQTAGQVEAALNQPVPPLVYDFRGFMAIIDNLEGMDIATQRPPEKIDGRFLLSMNNVQGLLAMGQMFVPELAAMDLQPDGKPTALDIPQVNAMVDAAFAAMSSDALAIGIGADSESMLSDMLDADAADQPPLFNFSMDAERYYTFLTEAVEESQAGMDEETRPSPEMEAASLEVMKATADLYERMSTDIMLTERGVEISSAVTFGD